MTNPIHQLRAKIHFCILFKFSVFHLEATLLNLSSNAKFLIILMKAVQHSWQNTDWIDHDYFQNHKL